MKRWIMAVMIGSTATCAKADIIGTLQEQFTCPQANCTTSCVGPGGAQTIRDYRTLSAFLLSQPDRLWLYLDGVRVIVLGTADRCTFDGTPIPIGVQGLPPVPIPPVPPQCTCFNNQCSPPHCNGH